LKEMVAGIPQPAYRLVKGLKFQGLYLGRNEIFCARPEWLLSLQSLLYNESFLEVKSG